MGAIGAYAMVSEGQIMRPALSLRAVGCSAAASAATLVIRVAQDLEDRAGSLPGNPGLSLTRAKSLVDIGPWSNRAC